MGKTICDELCFSISGENWQWGSPINPQDPRRFTGGSSAGSGAATAAGLCEYPEGCLEAMQANFNCHVLKASDIAMQLGSAKCMNVVLFGAMTKVIGLDDIDWETVIRETVPPKFIDLNLRAYEAGREAVL